jgi:hypothetical protein
MALISVDTGTVAGEIVYFFSILIPVPPTTLYDSAIERNKWNLIVIAG